jgi:hypothetical protein
VRPREPQSGGAVSGEPSPLILALAAMVRSAALNVQTQTRYALDHGEPLCEPCSCRADVGAMRCTCAVELPMTAAWRRRATQRLERREHVGLPPRRRCRLCRSSDHDLVATHEMRVTVVGGSDVMLVRIPDARTANRRRDAERAARAGAYPPGTWAAQRLAAGIG